MIFIDRPIWPGHGRLWAHLISDTSYDELHRFARRNGLPDHAFERDHYDVPADQVIALTAAGATMITSRELVAVLWRAGLRRRHRSRLAPRVTEPISDAERDGCGHDN